MCCGSDLTTPRSNGRCGSQLEAHGAEVVLIEDRASGTQLIQEFRSEGLYQVTAFSPDGDKVMRLNSQAAMIENGFVHLPSDAHWLTDFLKEITTFPNARCDDQAEFDIAGVVVDQTKWHRTDSDPMGEAEKERQDAASIRSVATGMAVIRPGKAQLRSISTLSMASALTPKPMAHL